MTPALYHKVKAKHPRSENRVFTISSMMNSLTVLHLSCCKEHADRKPAALERTLANSRDLQRVILVTRSFQQLKAKPKQPCRVEAGYQRPQVAALGQQYAASIHPLPLDNRGDDDGGTM